MCIRDSSIIRTVTAVERADVVVVVIDAKEGVTEQDAKLSLIHICSEDLIKHPAAW